MGRLSKVFDTAKQDSNESKKERKEEIVNLNFKVSAEVRRKIKQYAAKHDKSLKEVFESAIDFYMEHNP
jgi:predicted HicB family RNase H-like nuclease